MLETLLAAATFLEFQVCELDTNHRPAEFTVRDSTVYIRRDVITGFSPKSQHAGAPCVRLLVDGKTLFVLGPAEQLKEILETPGPGE